MLKLIIATIIANKEHAKNSLGLFLITLPKTKKRIFSLLFFLVLRTDWENTVEGEDTRLITKLYYFNALLLDSELMLDRQNTLLLLRRRVFPPSIISFFSG